MGRIERSFGGRAPARDKEQERPPLVLETRGHGEGGEREGEGGRRAPPQQGGRHPRKEDEVRGGPRHRDVRGRRRGHHPADAPRSPKGELGRLRPWPARVPAREVPHELLKGLNLSKDSLFRSLSFNDDSFFDYR